MMMSMGTFFSVLIPAFKAAYLKECIDSVLNQSYQKFELIIVNDASPEDIDGVVNQFNDERIRYYKNTSNIGAVDVVDNWNMCLNYSMGDYVICMGDDDRLLLNCLEVYNDLINRNPDIGLLHGWTEVIDEDSKVVELGAHRCYCESAMSLLWHRKKVYAIQYIGDFCFNSKDLKGNGGFYKLPAAWGSDDISAVIAASKNGVVNTQEVVFQYRRNSRTISLGAHFVEKMQAICNEEEWIKTFLSKPCESKYDELYRIQLAKEIGKIENKKKSVLISYDLRQNGIGRLFFWFRYRKKYFLTKKEIALALLKKVINQ